MSDPAFTTQAWTTSRRTVARIEFEHRRAECRALQVESTPKGQHVRIFMEPNEVTDAAWQGLTLQLPDGAVVEVRGSDFYHVDLRRPDGTFAGWLTSSSEDAGAMEPAPRQRAFSEDEDG